MDEHKASEAEKDGTYLSPDEEYLRLVKRIMSCGEERSDRTGVGTLSLFGQRMRFSLQGGAIPLLTTKRVSFKLILKELLWMVKGSTREQDLSEVGVKFWKANASREFLDARGLNDYQEGDLGPLYGFQWRHSGATYEGCDADNTGKGVDQLQNVIRMIQDDPTSRRIVMNAWIPSDIPKMALPPCHMFCQFYVYPKTNELSCQMYQRSGDMGLGVPFNIASYAILTHLIAHTTGLKAKELVHVIGDAHVYLNHRKALEEQCRRKPKTCRPGIKILKKEGTPIDNYTYEDVVLQDYKPHKTIYMKMAV